jgi:crossover junction endodeoxyribonuclease RuvC
MEIGGVDPGLKGAVASWDGRHLSVVGVPTMAAASRGRDIDWATLSFEIDLIFNGVDHFFIERVGARPGQGVSSMFKFGFVAGGLRGLIASMAIPVTYVVPTVWKKAMGLSASKDAAFARACELFPSDVGLFRGPKGGIKDGFAEAALIARYGYDKLVRQS